MTTLPTHDMQSARGKQWSRVLLLATLGLFGTTVAQAQTLNYTASGASNTTTTYTDLGTAGTVIATTNNDDANSAAQSLGFAFSFNGQSFTEFILNTNGFIKLGNTAPSFADFFYAPELTIGNDAISSTDPLDTNLLIPFNVDLQNGATGTAEYRVATTGAAGSHVTTIQWKNVSDKAMTNATQYNSLSFQVKLYEGSNNIEFVYDVPTPSAGADAFRLAGIGIKGSGNAAGQDLLVGKSTSSAAWSSATAVTFLTGNYSGFGFNYRRTAPPDAGRTFRFTPVSASTVDAGVSAVYTLGRISQTYASPHAVQAVVTNSGGAALTNLPVTLSVTGANTFTNTQTVASLAAGASTTVTFTAYPLSALGTNSVTVTANATGDSNTANNAQVVSQEVTPGTLNYISAPATATFDGGLGSNTAANVLLFTKYTINGTANVTAITPTFNGTATATNTYQVLVYDATGTGGTPGTVLYTSATRTRPATAISETVAITPTAVTGSFYVAVKQLTTTNVGVAYQDEVPGRPGTFYVSTTGTTFTDLNGAAAFDLRLAIEATLSSTSAATCAPVTALAIGSITDNTASVSFTPGAGNTSYTVTYTPAGGTATTITPAPTASPVALSGLIAGTAYTVSVTPICSAGGTATAVTTTFTTTGGATCPPVTGASVGSITFTSGSLIFTPAAGAVDYDLTLDTTVGGGTPATATVTASPVNLTNLTPGTSYTITITTNCASGVSSVVTVVFTTNTPPVPANDDCLGATPLTVVAGACTTPTTGTNLGATTSSNVANPTCSNFSGGDVWFSFIAPTNGIVNIETGAVSNSDVTDTGMALYTGSCGNLTEVDCDDDSSTGFFSLINSTGLTPGNTYYVRVFDYANAEFGDFTICATTSVPCPAVTDLLATSNAAGTTTSIAFTPSTPATSYTVTYAATGGAVQTVTTPVTASPIVLNGLTPYTSYSVTVVGSCGGGLTSLPATLTFLTTPYCSGTADGLGGDCGTASISTVAIAGTTLNNANNGCTSVETSTFPAAYSAFPTTSANTASLTAGQSYQLSVTTSDDAITSVWVDFDHNGTFDASEWTQVSTTSTAGTATTVTLAVPVAAVPGVTGMRVRSRATGNSNGSGDACSDFGSGEAEDYLVTILAPTATHSALAGGFVSVYPNPAHQSFTVSIPAVSSARKAQVDIINTLGQVVRTQAVNLNTNLTQATIDAANLATGLYTVRVRTGQETATVRLTIQ